MENYSIDFISEENLKSHIRETIEKYQSNVSNTNLKKFNRNIIDPIKLLFDQKVYMLSDEELVNQEVRRQQDKSNSNAIGYFHQNLFKYIENCEVPNQGFDVIFNDDTYIEMKNKHNTMNAASSQKTYIKFQHKILEDDEAKCYLVEVIAKKSQNIKWKISLDGRMVSHKNIRRLSIDKFLEEVTGDSESFKKLCEVIPVLMSEVLEEQNSTLELSDNLLNEIREVDENIIDAFMKISFNEYSGFEDA